MKRPPLLTVLGDRWYYCRRVPHEVANLDRRGIIRQTTKILVAQDKDGKHAQMIAREMDAANLRYWGDLLAGRNANALKQLDDGIKRARSLGIAYRSVEDLSDKQKTALSVILKRLEDPRVDLRWDADDRTAVMGRAAQVCGIHLSQLVGLYEDTNEIQRRTEFKTKDEDQLNQWRGKHEGVIRHLREALGGKDDPATDRDLAQLMPEDGDAFRDWWKARNKKFKYKNESARKEFDMLSMMVRHVCKEKRLPKPHFLPEENPFPPERDNHRTTRPSFEIEFVRDVIVKGGPRDLDPKLFDALMVMINTGTSPSEIFKMPKVQIYLQHKIPHLGFRFGDGRALKQISRIREIPLVGVSLPAQRRNPNGWLEWRNDIPKARNAINDWLESLQGEVEPGCKRITLYSLRHTFKNRLRQATDDVELRNDIMCHKQNVPDYGRLTLEAKLEVLNRIAF